MRDIGAVKIPLDLVLAEPGTRVLGVLSGSALVDRWEEGRVEGGLAVELTFTRDKNKVRVRGSISGVAGFTCSRCLEPFSGQLEIAVDRIFSQGADPALAAREWRMDDDVVHVEAGLLEVGPLVVEEVILAAPMVPLCREGCLGLCPACGADRNRGGCDCSGGEKETPFASLGVLLGRGPEGR
ncbi:MAG: DUF177 domain-containing protein [Magnetococcales bacterium]|nr:DUF177 domain-containing protein [Magnetococcales bacterium]MBF0156962.1 DUF177 domain-containing protein [Magnetococcales bacterium]